MALTSKPLERVRSDVPVEDVIRGDQVRINLNVPESMRKRWKVAAIDADCTLSDLIISAMTSFLDSKQRK